MWTRKEALGKATGEGIGGVFREARGPEAKWQGGWTVAELTDLPGYAACVVSRSHRRIRQSRRCARAITT